LRNKINNSKVVEIIITLSYYLNQPLQIANIS